MNVFYKSTWMYLLYTVFYIILADISLNSMYVSVCVWVWEEGREKRGHRAGITDGALSFSVFKLLHYKISCF